MFRRLFDKCLALASPGLSKELDRRNARRAVNPSQWLVPEEAAVAWALAKIIVPSADGSPGMEDISRPDQTAVALLDKIVAEDSERQALYSHGLLAFDHWALNESGCEFADLSVEQQARLFRDAQQRHDAQVTGTSRIAKLRRAFEALIWARKGVFHAERLYPIIRNDCLQIFYTSSISWTWLQYDGPPMDQGYCSLTQSRLTGRLYG
jgi:Gluconate 2-dehydrogenase subunit 3